MESRPRRNRKSASLRALLTETVLLPTDFVLPLFIKDGKKVKEKISSMPGQFRLSIDEALKICGEARNQRIPAVALFPVIDDKLKDSRAKESKNPKGLVPKAIAEIKSKFPDLTIITDVAMDPYSSDGHDGFVQEGEIINDLTLPILAEQALAQAKAGADIVAPSDMMDGRVGFIRDALDENGFTNVGILSYSAKYASGFY
ncbi:MAG: porphobilinogen synthase, partial [Pseudobdellovibrionaceae bacterium]